MLEERVPWWLKSRHDNIFCWNFNVVLLFLSDKTSNLCNHLFPRKATQFRSRFCADLKLFGVPIPRVTHWLLSATRLSVTSFNVANASTLIGTLRHTPLRSWLQFQFRILSCVLQNIPCKCRDGKVERCPTWTLHYFYLPLRIFAVGLWYQSVQFWSDILIRKLRWYWVPYSVVPIVYLPWGRCCPWSCEQF